MSKTPDATQPTEYPAWVCDACGERWGRCIPRLCTMHMGECGVCGSHSVVTQPRDYGHLTSGWETVGGKRT